MTFCLLGQKAATYIMKLLYTPPLVKNEAVLRLQDREGLIVNCQKASGREISPVLRLIYPSCMGYMHGRPRDSLQNVASRALFNDAAKLDNIEDISKPREFADDVHYNHTALVLGAN